MSNSAPAVGFCVKVIEVLAESKTPIGISEISRRTEINKNMVSRILHTLEEENWVQCDEKSCYTLTLLPFCLSAKVVSRTNLANTCVPVLQKFWKEYGESTYLGILHKDEVLYLSHFDSVQNVKVAGVVGGSYPLYCTGPGKALLAFSGEEYIDEYISKTELKKRTPQTITDPEKLKEELAAIRERGYSLDDEEFGYGIVCMSAPVYDYTGEAIGVIGCSVSTIYCDAKGIYDYCGEKLMETARQISKCMGYVLQ